MITIKLCSPLIAKSPQLAESGNLRHFDIAVDLRKVRQHGVLLAGTTGVERQIHSESSPDVVLLSQHVPAGSPREYRAAFTTHGAKPSRARTAWAAGGGTDTALFSPIPHPSYRLHSSCGYAHNPCELRRPCHRFLLVKHRTLCFASESNR